VHAEEHRRRRRRERHRRRTDGRDDPTQGPAGDFFIDAIDLSLSPVGVPFPPVNGFLWLSPGLVVLASGVLDGAGRGTASMTIPSDTGLIGLRLFFQAGTLGASLNFTNVVDGPIAAY